MVGEDQTMVDESLLTPIPYVGFNLPLIAELPVNPELSPVLVTSSQGVMWVNDRDGLVRAAFRDDLGDFFRGVLTSSFEEGAEKKWQNSSPLSETGLKEAISFLQYYEIPEPYCLLLHPSKVDAVESTATATGLKVFQSSWLPADKAVLIPKDRTYLGSLIQHKSGMFAAVIHNISRGMFVLRFDS